MGKQADFLVAIGVTVGVAIGIFVAVFAFVVIRFYRKRMRNPLHANGNGMSPSAALPIRTSGIGISMDFSDSISTSEIVHESQQQGKTSSPWAWWGHQDGDLFASRSGIPRYTYKDVQKATQNFTTVLGQGSFGPVYKATMPTGETVAVKVLASNSKQGEKEFQTEVLLLARLHHRNLVNLVGYCVDKGQRMLIYEFMSNGNLANLLYGENHHVLSWDERLQVAHDVSHGIEYLHEGAVPPVIHRDLKSANILLDQTMRAKVADFGLSKEEVLDGRHSGLKGTYGYIDPEYMSTNRFTKKSDIYSFGIILFELLTAINPQQGLSDYIDLAAMSADGKGGWDEILDQNLVGKCDLEEVQLLATIAYRCTQKVPRKRPSIGDVSLAISRIRQRRLTKRDTSLSLSSISFTRGEIPHIVKQIKHQQIELSSMASIKE
ncbi:calcium/calmodulin-regulated receptor-like kinase 2 isoform X1 [Aristolochia californica]|uniref:calcium/calmodulin-regulated receptor-like kinase 2 isoform X1 n=1 Tax=Aristolochia californica TaxID=171875 RepID=UPI0035D7F6DB